MPNLILASSSSFRKMLLERLRVPFTCVTPAIDETAKPEESPKDLVMRLSRDKAHKVADAYPDSLIIGSDQVAVCRDSILGKPGTKANAFNQLQQMCGERVQFHSGIYVYNASTESEHGDCISVEVQFRDYRKDEIIRYLEKEDALQCAGAFRSEGLGISMVRTIHSNDPTALIGLPLITLQQMLVSEGLSIP